MRQMCGTSEVSIDDVTEASTFALPGSASRSTTRYGRGSHPRPTGFRSPLRLLAGLAEQTELRRRGSQGRSRGPTVERCRCLPTGSPT